MRLAHEAELAVVAPATANLLAKLASGLADDLLTSTLLEYHGPLVVAPAMHTGMWEHPATRRNVETLADRGVALRRTRRPARSPTATRASGAWPSPRRSSRARRRSRRVVHRPAISRGGVIVVTAGPTHEPIDPVRFIGNRSSGTMGVAVADEAARRGADVRLVLGPGTVAPPPGVRVAARDDRRADARRRARARSTRPTPS